MLISVFKRIISSNDDSSQEIIDEADQGFDSRNESSLHQAFPDHTKQITKNDIREKMEDIEVEEINIVDEENDQLINEFLRGSSIKDDPAPNLAYGNQNGYLADQVHQFNHYGFESNGLNGSFNPELHTQRRLFSLQHQHDLEQQTKEFMRMLMQTEQKIFYISDDEEKQVREVHMDQKNNLGRLRTKY